MSLSIGQTAEYAKDGHWNWSVWIDGPDAELDQIAAVEYVLHATFPNPVRVVKRRDNKFRLDSKGWEEFEINAHLTTKTGTRQHLKRWIRLAEAGEPAEELVRKKGPPVAFVSAGITDTEWEDAFREALNQRGCEVLTASDLPGGVPWETAINQAFDRADVVVGIFSGRSSAWTEREVMKALDNDVSVVPVAVGPQAKVPTSLEGLQTVHVGSVGDVGSAVGQVLDRLR